jgi:hypothetical protein
MTTLHFALVGLVGLIPFAQEPAGKSATDFAALATQCTAGGVPALEAYHRLPIEVAADYAGAHAAWRSMPEGKPRTVLASFLELPCLDAADVVVTGILDGVEAIQGGVIDHHTVLLTFGKGVTVHRAPAEIAQELAQTRTFVMLRGTSHDAWLASVLVRQMRTTAGVHTFAFKKQELQHVTPGAAGGNVPRHLLLHECHLLPAGAGRVAVGSAR